MSEEPPARTPRIHQLRARYARRVTPDHLGERVSVRQLIDDPVRGPMQSDVVGRLVGADTEALLVVDRQGQLTAVDTARVLSSRVVPAHPRFEPEPMVGTPDAPLVRDAARVLVLDDADRVLLVAHAPDQHRTVWTAPGGGRKPEESHAAAAARELREEIGVDAEVGPWIWSRRVTFDFRGCTIDQSERWFLVRVQDAATEDAPLDDPGLVGVRWWDAEELATTDAELAPATLATHLARLVAEGPPPEPVDVGR